jgi:hypothetical protein
MAIIDPLFSILDFRECARLASEVFLSSLRKQFSITLLGNSSSLWQHPPG